MPFAEVFAPSSCAAPCGRPVDHLSFAWVRLCRVVGMSRSHVTISHAVCSTVRLAPRRAMIAGHFSQTFGRYVSFAHATRKAQLVRMDVSDPARVDVRCPMDFIGVPIKTGYCHRRMWLRMYVCSPPPLSRGLFYTRLAGSLPVDFNVDITSRLLAQLRGSSPAPSGNPLVPCENHR